MKKFVLEAEAQLPTGYASRLANGDRKKTDPETLKRIAAALDVSYEWLSLGRGTMVEHQERYHAMPAIRAMARADKYPADFVEKFEALLDLDDQPTADDLWRIFKETYAASKGKAPARKADPMADLDRPKKALKRK